MGNDNDRFAVNNLMNGTVHLLFIFGINKGRSLVKYDDRCIL